MHKTCIIMGNSLIVINFDLACINYDAILTVLPRVSKLICILSKIKKGLTKKELESAVASVQAVASLS